MDSSHGYAPRFTVVLLFLAERVILIHLQAGILEQDVLASGVRIARLHFGVMLVLIQALSNLQGISVLAKSLLHLSGDVVGRLAVFTDLEGSLQLYGDTNRVLGD